MAKVEQSQEFPLRPEFSEQYPGGTSRRGYEPMYGETVNIFSGLCAQYLPERRYKALMDLWTRDAENIINHPENYGLAAIVGLIRAREELIKAFDIDPKNLPTGNSIIFEQDFDALKYLKNRMLGR